MYNNINKIIYHSLPLFFLTAFFFFNLYFFFFFFFFFNRRGKEKKKKAALNILKYIHPFFLFQYFIIPQVRENKLWSVCLISYNACLQQQG
jgi:hypothetical protein